MTKLLRSIGLVHATALVVGIIVGASIFVQPALVTSQVPSVAGVLLLWTTAGVLTLVGSLVIAELASAFPKTGGVYVFLREAFSPPVGFLWGWAMFWTMHSGIIAVIAMVFARYMASYLVLGEVGVRAVAIAAVLALSAVNYRGVRQGSVVQVVLTSVKVAALLLIVAAAINIARQGGGALRLESGAIVTALPSPRAFASALIAGLFAYGGWHMVSYAAEETVNPTRTIPRALVAGTITVTALYVCVNAAYLFVLPLRTVASSTRIAADFADAAVGGSGAHILSALVVLSSLGAMNGVILAGPRVYLAMAEDGLLFKWVGVVHPVFRTPHKAIALQAAWSAVLVATGTYRTLFTRVVYTEWIFFGLLAVALFVFRRRAGYAPAYRVWGYPVLPALFACAAAVMVVNQLVREPAESLTGLGFVLTGLPVYYLWSRRHSTPTRRPGL